MAPRLFRLRALPAMALICAGTTAAASAQTFAPPTQLSVHGYAATTGVGIDAAGNAIATWADEGMWYATKPASGSWTPAQQIYIQGAFPVLRTTAAGTATLVSYQNLYGIWSDDYANGAWGGSTQIVNSPEIVSSLITNVAPVQFLSDSNGDQAVVFAQSLGSVTEITVVRRPAGGTWGSEDVAASSATVGDIALSSAALGDDGTLLVTFETYTVSCQRFCHDLNYVVHASREPLKTLQWSDSALTPASTTQYYTTSVVDPHGHAGVFVQQGFGSLGATTQAKAGAKWKPLATVFANGGQMWGAGASKGAHASLAIYGFGSVANATVIDGLLSKNVWPVVTQLSSGDSPGANNVMAFGANAAGGSMTEWADTDGTVRASFRQTFKAAWSTPQTVAAGSACYIGGLICTNPVAAAVNAAGHGVVGFLRTNPNDTSTQFWVSSE